MNRNLAVVECHDLPGDPSPDIIYRLLPKNFDQAFYNERTDRNIGWITSEEQEMLRGKVIGISGCGGMGGLLGQIFTRLGVGEVRICDTEVFDTSNINRQFGATRTTVGQSKAFVTARKIRETSDDGCLVVSGLGICPETVDQFLSGCDVVCDEIEFWAAGARVLLHQAARAKKIPIFNCNTIGFSTRLFLFTHASATMEECIGLTYDNACDLQKRVQTKKATPEEINYLKESVLCGLLPEFPEYCAPGHRIKNRERLFEEGKAPIIATNPPMATGFLADRILLYLLKDSPVKREIIQTPEMPAYLYFDAALMEAKVVRGRWW